MYRLDHQLLTQRLAFGSRVQLNILLIHAPLETQHKTIWIHSQDLPARSVVCSNHPERFREEACPVGAFGEHNTEEWNALAGITGGKLIDHRAEFRIHRTIPVTALLRVCLDETEGKECGELLLCRVGIKAKLVGDIGHGKRSRSISMQEQQHLQSEDSLDLFS